MKKVILSLLILLFPITSLAQKTEVIVGIKNQHINANDVCLEHIRMIAEISAQYWDTIRLDSTQIETFLPYINTPCSYQSEKDVFWIRAKMLSSYADSLQNLLLLKFDEYSGLLYQVILMRPVSTGELDENGNMILEMPKEPVWTEEIKDDDGNVIGEEIRMIGRIEG